MSSSNHQENGVAPTKEVSLQMTLVLVFITHSVVNWLLLMPWNTLRCSFWNVYECSGDINWILNWLAFSRFHMLIMLAFLAKTSMGNYILEQRLLVLCSVLMLNYVSTGVFAIHLLNKPMASMQCVIFMVMLAISLHHLTTSTVIPLPSQLRSTSFDMRRRLPISSVAVGVQCLLSMMRVSEMTLRNGRQGYIGDSSSPVYQIISSAAVNDMFFTALILGIYFMIGTVEQQKALLMAQIIALFISQALLAGSQGDWIEPEQVKAGGVATFFSILIAILGLA